MPNHSSKSRRITEAQLFEAWEHLQQREVECDQAIKNKSDARRIYKNLLNRSSAKVCKNFLLDIQGK